MPGIGESIALSIGLALMTCLFSLVLMLPTLLILHLKAPQMLPVAEGFSVLPYVVPAIALVSAVGPLYRIILPQALNSPLGLVPLYMVVIMPFVYRSLDAGIRVVDVRTLWDAVHHWEQVRLPRWCVPSCLTFAVPSCRHRCWDAQLF